jgi:hypothetical protein
MEIGEVGKQTIVTCNLKMFKEKIRNKYFANGQPNMKSKPFAGFASLDS